MLFTTTPGLEADSPVVVGIAVVTSGEFCEVVIVMGEVGGVEMLGSGDVELTSLKNCSN